MRIFASVLFSVSVLTGLTFVANDTVWAVSPETSTESSQKVQASCVGFKEINKKLKGRFTKIKGKVSSISRTEKRDLGEFMRLIIKVGKKNRSVELCIRGCKAECSLPVSSLSLKVGDNITIDSIAKHKTLTGVRVAKGKNLILSKRSKGDLFKASFPLEEVKKSGTSTKDRATSENTSKESIRVVKVPVVIEKDPKKGLSRGELEGSSSPKETLENSFRKESNPPGTLDIKISGTVETIPGLPAEVGSKDFYLVNSAGSKERVRICISDCKNSGGQTIYYNGAILDGNNLTVIGVRSGSGSVLASRIFATSYDNLVARATFNATVSYLTQQYTAGLGVISSAVVVQQNGSVSEVVLCSRDCLYGKTVGLDKIQPGAYVGLSGLMAKDGTFLVQTVELKTLENSGTTTQISEPVVQQPPPAPVVHNSVASDPQTVPVTNTPENLPAEEVHEFVSDDLPNLFPPISFDCSLFGDPPPPGCANTTWTGITGSTQQTNVKFTPFVPATN